MTLKYESEILFDLMKRDGDDAPSDVLPYESELKEKYLHQVEGAYPKLQDYRSEWLNYNLTGEVVEDIGEIVLDGSQTLQPHSIDQGDTLMVKISHPSISFKQNSSGQESWDFSDMICDKELIAETPKWDANEWNEGYNIALISSALPDTYNINSFVLAIRKSYFNVQSIDEFKSWLTQNPLTIRYKLAKESIKTVDLSCINEQGESETFRPIEGTMHLMTEGDTIKPLFSGEIPVEAITQNLTSFNEG